MANKGGEKLETKGQQSKEGFSSFSHFAKGEYNEVHGSHPGLGTKQKVKILHQAPLIPQFWKGICIRSTKISTMQDRSHQ